MKSDRNVFFQYLHSINSEFTEFASFKNFKLMLTETSLNHKNH